MHFFPTVFNLFFIFKINVRQSPIQREKRIKNENIIIIYMVIGNLKLM